MNVMVIIASQGAMALGGVNCGSTAAIAGTRFTLGWSGGAVLRESVSGSSALDLRYRKSRRNGLKLYKRKCGGYDANRTYETLHPEVDFKLIAFRSSQ
jgi:hypothetical protein